MNEQKYKGENLSVPAHQSPYPTSRLAPSMELVELAREVASADDLLTVQAVGKLRMLAEQIERLQDSARRILAETRRNQELHRVDCGFRKIPGQHYHLYRRPDQSMLFSMIGPAEWGGAGRHCDLEFAGTYRLESDKSFKRMDLSDAVGSDDQDVPAEGSGGSGLQSQNGDDGLSEQP
jgi:hypothetical protein